MREKVSLKIFWWVVLMLWMGVIFYFSAQPNLASGLDTFTDMILRKIAHMSEFGVLCYLWYRVLGSIAHTKKQRIILALVCSVLYALSDEWHQSFVAGRQGSIVDVFIDSVGIGVMAFLLVKKKK